MLEDELKSTKTDFNTERRHKRRLEKLIKDCTVAIRLVLRVRKHNYVKKCVILLTQNTHLHPIDPPSFFSEGLYSVMEKFDLIIL